MVRQFLNFAIQNLIMRVSVILCLLILISGICFPECDAREHEIAGQSHFRIDSLPSHPVIHSLWMELGADYVANSAGDDIREKISPEDKIRVNSALPLNLRYSFSFTDPKIRNYLPGGYQGLAIGLLNYGALQEGGYSRAGHNIGHPVLVYLFQGGPFHRFNQKFHLSYEWNFGASFGWKPYSESNKFFNLTVGSKVNAYLNLGLNLNWQINPELQLFSGLAISHFSNGNTSFPNPGVNQMGLRVGIRWILNPLSKGYPSEMEDTVNKRKIEYDISIWGASRKRVYRGGENPVLLPGHFVCAGISFAPMYCLNTWWRIGPSLDIQWDQSSDMKRNYLEGSTTEDIRFSTPSVWRQTTIGISAHGELRMPIFAVNIGCGYNLKAPWENRGSYQNITLKTYLCRYFFINVGYQLRNFHQQSSLMLGAGVTI